VPWTQILRSAALLVMFAVAGTGLVAMTYQATKERIAANQREALLRKIHGLVPPERYDNDPLADPLEVTDRDALGTADPVSVYRARKGNRPVAAILTPVAPDGYGGPIRLIVAVNYDGTVAGVRVLAHTETPGLGDYIDEERSDWILGFNGRALGDPPADRWKVKRDGGAFDQHTGATVTPRAVVKAVRRTLQYFVASRDRLFAQRPQENPRRE
jgi:H+/Na+-translocating ferredoxin:NAD+ oxidoreductase subunit G